jgi:alanyl-tRNA synthetase
MKIKTREELIKAYVDFFIRNGHSEIPSASLIPENDPTVLFTTAGMHPLVPYLLGQKHPKGTRLVDVQKCIRTGDIDEVGDETYHTFFEMLGNWSFGDYWKKDAIKFSFFLLTNVLEIPIDKLGVSCFEGNEDLGIEKDEESAEVWKEMGIKEERIVYLGMEDNWWGPAGTTGPCGPDTEMFYYTGGKTPVKFDPEDKKWVEIWNDVFMQYNKNSVGKYEELTQKNVDTGMGVERTLAVLNGESDNYKTKIFSGIIEKIEEISGKKYIENEKGFRIIADHIRSAVFILGDSKGINPGNIGQGYVLRRLIRRAVRYGKILGIKKSFTKLIAEVVVSEYSLSYSELNENKDYIYFQLEEEEKKFEETLEKGLGKFENMVKGSDGKILAKNAFLLFQSYGFPIEMTVELAREKDREVDVDGFNEEFKIHQELSRTANSGTFKSGLADDSEMTTKLHTATHLLNEALRRVLNDDEVRQRGSNINPERLRFDFSFSRKMTDEEIKEVEDLVNEKIGEGLDVKREEMALQEAIDSNAQAEFGAKYPDIVSVYSVIDPKDERGWWSREICTGPHVVNTKEIGNFKIVKEQSISAGIRRIKAIIS